MLTQDQLTRIKKKASNTWIYNDVITLLMEIERLTRHNKQMQAALAQLSDKEYWTSAPSVRYVESGEWPSPLDTRVHIWHGVSDPQQLAEHALIHNPEVSHEN